jgi:hypothetical protein
MGKGREGNRKREVGDKGGRQRKVTKREQKKTHHRQ